VTDPLSKLESKLDKVSGDVQSIRDMLISEPEASPLGRALLRKSVENRELIDEIRADFDPMYDWWQQTRGVWRAVVGLGIVLGIVGSFFGLAAYFHP
jgi:hypothetical protein